MILPLCLGCPSEPSPPAQPGPAGEADALATRLPCAVEAVLRDRCQSCHGATPVAGAPMALMRADDFHTAARSDRRLEVWEVVSSRIHDERHPMPPIAPLSFAEMQTLDGWLLDRAPSIDGPACPAATAARDRAEPLPCAPSEQVRLTAHGARAGTPFHVPPEAGNILHCFSWRAPFAGPTQATAFAGIVGDARVLHHWALYQTAVPQADGGEGPCALPADARLITAWEPGWQMQVFPPPMGLALPGQDRWLVLQVHYTNAAGHRDADDASGVAMCTTRELRPRVVDVTALGTEDIEIEPRTEAEISGLCTPPATEPIHLLSAAPHMHGSGIAARMEILRGGDPGRAELVLDVPHYDWNYQELYPIDREVAPGDKIRTTCKFFNRTENALHFGEALTDEMCYSFVYAWPAGALARDAANNSCFE